MADSSLDDFFAKKDKSRKKSKSKSSQVGDGDDVSKSKNEKKVKKKRDKDFSSTGGSQNSSGLPNANDDEEWKDFEEEKEVDYTGLRIQSMQIAKEEQERELADAEDEGYDEDGELRERKDGFSGPWNKGNEPPPAPSAAPAPEPEKEPAAPVQKTPGKYVPPSLRNQPAASSPAAFPTRRKKEAPNLQSEEDFPTLGGGPGSGKPSHYSSSASTDLIENPGQRRGGNLQLENKFAALQD